MRIVMSSYLKGSSGCWTAARSRVGWVASTMASFAPDVCGLDDWSPPSNFLGLIFGERLRSLLLNRRYLLADVPKPLQGLLISQHLSDRCIESGSDVRGNASWRPDRMPVEEVEPTQTGFVDRGNFGRRSQPAGRRH